MSTHRLIKSILFLLILGGCRAGIEINQNQAATTTPLATSTIQPSATPSPTISETPTASATATRTVEPSPTATPTKIGGSGQIIFDGLRNENNQVTSLGVQLLDLDDMSITPVIEDYYLMANSPPSGIKFSDFDFFSLYDLFLGEHDNTIFFLSPGMEEAIPFIDSSFGDIEQVYWFPSGKIAFISWLDGNRYLFFLDKSQSEDVQVVPRGLRPIHIFSSNGLGCLYFGSGVANENRTSLEKVWCQPFNGSEPQPVDIPFPFFSPVDSIAAYFSYDETHNKLNITIQDMNRNKKTVIKEKIMDKKYEGANMVWSPDGKQLLATLLICSPSGILKGECGPLSEYLLFGKKGEFIKKLTLPSQIMVPIERFEWSPDGNSLLFEAQLDASPERHQFLYNLQTDELIDLHPYFGDGFFFGQFFWLNGP